MEAHNRLKIGSVINRVRVRVPLLGPLLSCNQCTSVYASLMHTKLKGNIGQAAIVKRLAELGYNVFSELGDLSKVDLIAEKEGKLLRLQCKAMTSRNGTVEISLLKSGPNNYRREYTVDMFDYFAVYVLDQDLIGFIPSVKALENNRSYKLRISDSKNKQEKAIHWLKDFAELPC